MNTVSRQAGRGGVTHAEHIQNMQRPCDVMQTSA